MPSKHVVKPYVAGGDYHVYNRGVEKRQIFMDDQDYRVFLNILRTALTKNQRTLPRRRLNFNEEVELIAFCLMPNHFHLLLCQKTQRAIISFMRSVMNAYAGYFNKKYDRVGKLCQGPFKANRIVSDAQLIQTTVYIHRNPLGHGVNLEDLPSYPYSSYPVYLSKRDLDWVETAEILDMAGGVTAYRQLVEVAPLEVQPLNQGVTL